MRTPARSQARHSTTIAPHIRIAVAFLLICIALVGASEAFADEGDTPLSNLVKFDGQDYRVTAEDWVSLDPISATTVQKIGYGKITEVNIATTTTGTYSSDAIVSPYVLYPGIEVEPVTSGAQLWDLVSEALLSHGATSSISHIGHAPDGTRTYSWVTNLGLRSCMSGGSFTACSVSR